MSLTIVEKPQWIRDGAANAELSEIEILECDRNDTVLHVMWELDTGERRVRDSVGVEKKIT